MYPLILIEFSNEHKTFKRNKDKTIVIFDIFQYWILLFV